MTLEACACAFVIDSMSLRISAYWLFGLEASETNVRSYGVNMIGVGVMFGWHSGEEALTCTNLCSWKKRGNKIFNLFGVTNLSTNGIGQF